MKKVYVGGKFSGRERILREVALLRKHFPDIRIVSSWLTTQEEVPETAPGTSIAETPLVNAYLGLKDREEIASADVVIIDTIDESNTGGREVEYGMALMLRKRTIVVGPRRNVFHFIASEHVNRWEDVLI